MTKSDLLDGVFGGAIILLLVLFAGSLLGLAFGDPAPAACHRWPDWLVDLVRGGPC